MERYSGTCGGLLACVLCGNGTRKGAVYYPLKNQYAFENVDMATFQGLFDACLNVVNWTMFLTGSKA